MNIYEVIKKPLVTEKGTRLQESAKYLFEVAMEANKQEIKEAVEHNFNVKVKAVNVMRVPGKMKRVGRRYGQSSPWKKAIVTLEAGNKIQLFEGV